MLLLYCCSPGLASCLQQVNGSAACLPFALKLLAANTSSFLSVQPFLTGTREHVTSKVVIMPATPKCMRTFTDSGSVCCSLQVVFDVNELKVVGQKQAVTDPARVADLIADA